MKAFLLLSLVFTIMLAGCRTVPNMSEVSIGMSEQEVYDVLGTDGKLIGTKRFPNGIVRVIEYADDPMWDGRMGPAEAYWLYFLNGELEQLGRPGDWKREADRIYEIRYR